MVEKLHILVVGPNFRKMTRKNASRKWFQLWKPKTERVSVLDGAIIRIEGDKFPPGAHVGKVLIMLETNHAYRLIDSRGSGAKQYVVDDPRIQSGPGVIV